MVKADRQSTVSPARAAYSIWLWLAGWLLLLALLTAGLVVTQRRVVESLDRPEAKAQWQLWKQEAERQTKLGAGPVQRKAPRTNEPPALILMRDHFTAVWGCAALLASCLYAFLATALRGAVRTHANPGSVVDTTIDRP